MDSIYGVIGIVFTFSVAIFVHELGHFLFAKLFGVHVETFSIGFGRKIWKRKWGETEYALSLLPIGGYVKLRGMHSKEVEQLIEEDEQVPDDDGKDESPATAARPAPQHETMTESVVEEMNALRTRPYWQKILILGAGCINNFLTAVIVYFFMLWIGYHEAEPTKPDIEKLDDVSADVVKLRPGDLVLKVGDKKTETFIDFLDEFQNYAREKKALEVPVEVRRDGRTELLSVPAWSEPGFPGEGGQIVELAGHAVGSVKAAAEEAARLLDKADRIEVIVARGDQRTTRLVTPIAATGPYWPGLAIRFREIPFVAVALPNLPAEKAGFQSGDIIVGINGTSVETRAQATDLIRAAIGSDTAVDVVRDGTTVSLVVNVRPDPENPNRGQIGIYWGTPLTKWRQLPFFKAWREAFSRGGLIVVRYVEQLKELFRSSFQTIRENVGGPIAIATIIYKATQGGVVWFFEFFAMFNILLAVFNLLPLPILDGGHILFATIEAIIRRPLPGRIMMAIYNIFIFLLIGLMVIVTFNDLIMNAWRLW